MPNDKNPQNPGQAPKKQDIERERQDVKRVGNDNEPEKRDLDRDREEEEVTQRNPRQGQGDQGQQGSRPMGDRPMGNQGDQGKDRDRNKQ